MKRFASATGRGLCLLFLQWNKKRICSSSTAHNRCNRRMFQNGGQLRKKASREKLLGTRHPKPTTDNATAIGDDHGTSRPLWDSCDCFYNESSGEQWCCVMWEALIKWYIGFIYLLFVWSNDGKNIWEGCGGSVYGSVSIQSEVVFLKGDLTSALQKQLSCQ